jgi:uncharacterized protein YjbI with pentapeptide repeats
MVQCKYLSETDEVQCEEQALSDSPDGLCIFHEELRNKNIKTCMKKFYERIQNGETNFEGFILQDVNFLQEGITQIGDEDCTLWFTSVKFYGGFSAKGMKWESPVSFRGASFHGDAEFEDAIFTNEVNFDTAIFFGKTLFSFVSFYKDAHFSKTMFCKPSEFVNIRFRGPVFFNEAIFEKVANFTSALFEKGGSFSHARIDNGIFENTNLRDVTFEDVQVANCKWYGAKIYDINLAWVNWRTSWKSPWRKYILKEDAEARNASTMCQECMSPIVNDRTCQCDICGRLFVEMHNDFLCPKCNTKNIAFSKRCIHKDCDVEFSTKVNDNRYSDSDYRATLFRKAEDVYRTMKLILMARGDYRTAGDFYFNEMIMRRKKNYYERNIGEWLTSHVYSKLCGYGERAGRVIAASSAIVLFFAILYYLNQALIKLAMPSHSVDFIESLFFSFASFTIAGSGDYTISQTFQLVTIIERVLGGFLISMFILVFGRKMLR